MEIQDVYTARKTRAPPCACFAQSAFHSGHTSALRFFSGRYTRDAKCHGPGRYIPVKKRQKARKLGYFL